MGLLPRTEREIGLLFIWFLVSCGSVFAEETIAITTYYPSPYGSYNELRTYSNTYLAIESGRVGIGTTAPSVNLEVYSTSDNEVYVINTQSSGYAYLRAYNSTGSAALELAALGPTTAGITFGIPHTDSVSLFGYGVSRFSIGAQNNIPLYVTTNNLPRMTITGAGNVGIGATNPQHILDISGAMYSRRYATTSSIDWSLGNTQSITISANTTFTFSNGQDGGKYTLIIKWSNTSATLSWPATVRWPGGIEPTWTRSVGITDYVAFIYNGVDSKYDAIAYSLYHGSGGT